MTCPNINLDSWKQLVEDKGESLAYYLWFKYNGDVSQFLTEGEELSIVDNLDLYKTYGLLNDNNQLIIQTYQTDEDVTNLNDKLYSYNKSNSNNNNVFLKLVKTSKGFVIKLYKKFNSQQNYSQMSNNQPISVDELIQLSKDYFQRIGVDLNLLAKKSLEKDVKLNDIALYGRNLLMFGNNKNVKLDESTIELGVNLIEQLDNTIFKKFIIIMGNPNFKNLLNDYVSSLRNSPKFKDSSGRVDILAVKKKLLTNLLLEAYKFSEAGTTLPSTDYYEIIGALYQAFKSSINSNLSKFEIFDQAVKDILLNESDTNLIELRKELSKSNRSKFVRDAVNNQYDKFVEENNNITPPDNNDEVDRHYKYKNQRVATTVTTLIKKGKEFFRTENQKIQDDFKKLWGTEGHAYIDNLIKTNYIDSDGQLLNQFKNEYVETKLSDDVKNAINSYIYNLMSNYRRADQLRTDGVKTRILTEVRVVNTKVQGIVASTIDFMAIVPDDVQGFKIDTLDWKFVDINKQSNIDIPFYKRKDWNAQMNEYLNMYKTNLYGVKNEQIGKSRMVPIVANYKYVNYNKPEEGLYLNSIEIEDLTNPENNTIYTMPVPVLSELTGIPKVDELIKQLNIQYDKLYKHYYKDLEKQSEKDETLNQLAVAIRSLHANLDFTELIKFTGNFIESIENDLSNLENIDYENLNNSELNDYYASIVNFENTATKFLNIDVTYISTFSDTELEPVALENLQKIRDQSFRIENLIERIQKIKSNYVVQLSVNENLVKDEYKEDVLQAEKEIGYLSRTFLESSQLSSDIVKLATNLLNRAKSLMQINTNEQIDSYYDILTKGEQKAKSLGKSVSDLILQKNKNDIVLIRELSKNFWESFKNAKLHKSKEFFIENVDKSEFEKLLNETLTSKFERIDNKSYGSTNDLYIEVRRNQEKEKLKKSLDLFKSDFDGYDNSLFKIIFLKSLVKDKWESKEYKELKKYPEILKVWEFYRGMNKRAKTLGYLSKKDTLSFFPLIQDSFLNKLLKTKDLTGETKDFFQSFYKVTAEEGQRYSKLDPETNELKRYIPTFYTSNSSGVEALSTDLRKVGALWIKALNEYETSKELETVLMICHDVEKSKGVIVTDEKGNIVKDEKGNLKIDYANKSNSDLIKTIMDDGLYGIKENNNSFFDVQFKRVGKSLNVDDTKIENVSINVKKMFTNLQGYMQGLAIGLKFSIAIPNYLGVNFQSYINGGRYYKFSEFSKNNAKITTGLNLSLEEKALLNKLSVLNEDIASSKIREKAYKDSYVDWLRTWNFNDVMMVTNAWPEKQLQLVNALSFIDNSMIVDGKIVNIRQYLQQKDRNEKYNLSESERKQLENSFEDRVKKYQEERSLSKVSKIVNDSLIIPNVSPEELAKFRLTIFEYGRKLNGQLSDTNKAQYRRDTIFKSFMTFKNWIPKQVSNRILDIREDYELGTWEYGRVRLFIKTATMLSFRNIYKITDIIAGTDEGLKLMKQMLDSKRIEYFEKTGKELRITDEEFYDLVRTELSNEVKELKLLLTLILLGISTAFLKGDDDDDDDLFTRNKLKYFAKLIHKVSDEVSFYYNPLSFQSITSGSVIPALSIFYKIRAILDSLWGVSYGYIIDDQDLVDKSHVAKSAMDMIPILSQFQKEYLPLIDPELAKELGIKTTDQPRIMR